MTASDSTTFGSPLVKKDGTPAKPNLYRQFVKDNYAKMRDELLTKNYFIGGGEGGGKILQKDVMQALGKRWKDIKSTTGHQSNDENVSNQILSAQDEEECGGDESSFGDSEPELLAYPA